MVVQLYFHQNSNYQIFIIFHQLSKSVMKYHTDKRMKEQRVKKEESARLKRIASSISKEIKQFWQSVEKVSSAVV